MTCGPGWSRSAFIAVAWGRMVIPFWQVGEIIEAQRKPNFKGWDDREDRYRLPTHDCVK
jgi:hypothetical protein